MMTKGNDEAQRKARARALRIRIERLKSRGGATAAGPSVGEAPEQESPHEFVERRMREIAAQERGAAAAQSGGTSTPARRAGKKAGRSTGKKR
jgi:hypothetical protein